METIGAYEAKTKLGQLLERVQAGEQITITKHGVPVAVLRAAPDHPGHAPAQAIAELKKFRRHHTLAGLSLKQMIEEGRD
ncbi:type II toxin-antitoxin system Phd/YefM family antitoxin [Desulfurivibrio sp. C05AmB]|uniref:type II toxin-antitoxin system Phd/YefM family antitoxin n=1 Tax=Desulfurivibrio sp. C05AmB TaxID=3374371 RepID=UPI00376EFE4D